MTRARGAGRWLGLVAALCAFALTGCLDTHREQAAARESASLSSARAERGEGHLIEWERIGARGLPDQRVTIWLPEGYERGTQRYGVLYMHDGHNLFDPARASYGKVWAADKAMIALSREGAIAPHIIVGIWAPGEDRYRQYLPPFIAERARGPLAQSIARHALGKPVLSRRYLEWIADELKPRIDREFRTLADPRHTAIAGSSMGGLMACYAIVERPEVFGRAACVSAHWPAADPQVAQTQMAQVIGLWRGWLDERLGPSKGRRIWMDHGTETLDRHYAPYQAAIDQAFERAHWRREEDFVSARFEGAEHDENAWAKRLPTILRWLLKDS